MFGTQQITVLRITSGVSTHKSLALAPAVQMETPDNEGSGCKGVKNSKTQSGLAFSYAACALRHAHA